MSAHRTIAAAFMAAAVMAGCSLAMAQSPINSYAAMQPSAETWLIHQMLQYEQHGSDAVHGHDRTEQIVALTQINYGVTSEFSLQLEVPLVGREIDDSGGGEDIDRGLGDLTLMGKLRLWQQDTSPIDTMRFSLLAGLQIPGSVGLGRDNSSDAWNPIVGGVFSAVRGRHGFNADATFELHTGGGHDSSDTVRADASYLYRLAPKEYGLHSSGAWYGALELNGVFDTNGDHELFLSPGLMFEAARVTLDVTIMLPISQQVDHRAETDFIVGLGVRLSF